MQDGVACGKLTKSFTGGRFLVSPEGLQVFRRRREAAGNAADRRGCCYWWFHVLHLTQMVHYGVLVFGLK